MSQLRFWLRNAWLSTSITTVAFWTAIPYMHRKLCPCVFRPVVVAESKHNIYRVNKLFQKYFFKIRGRKWQFLLFQISGHNKCNQVYILTVIQWSSSNWSHHVLWQCVKYCAASVTMIATSLSHTESDESHCSPYVESYYSLPLRHGRFSHCCNPEINSERQQLYYQDIQNFYSTGISLVNAEVHTYRNRRT
jgi:hypothetical protein